jgi:hypothetical protein
MIETREQMIQLCQISPYSEGPAGATAARFSSPDAKLTAEFLS